MILVNETMNFQLPIMAALLDMKKMNCNVSDMKRNEQNDFCYFSKQNIEIKSIK